MDGKTVEPSSKMGEWPQRERFFYMSSVLASFSVAAKHPARWIGCAARWSLGLVVLAWTILILAWLVLHWAILPHINDWRSSLEQQASTALGLKVRIGAIEVRSGGWMPTLELRDVRLLDPAEREALHLTRICATLSARSVLALQLRFEQLLIEAPELVIRRDAQGKVFIAGLSMDKANETEASGAADAWIDWLFAQNEFAITQGRVRWIDELRAAPPLELSAVNLVLRNGLRSHELRLDATPPPAWGEPFTLRGRFKQSLLKRASELRYWSGQLYADLPRTDVRELRRHIDLPFELSEGDGALSSVAPCAPGWMSRTARRAAPRWTWRCAPSSCA
jgi:uncharacterized protein YhdP